MSTKRGHKKHNRQEESPVVEKYYFSGTSKSSPFSETFICSRCEKPIKDISAALTDKADGNPVHFDCVLDFLKKSETLNDDEALTYIGQGRFAVIKYASMVTMKEFSIVRIIEWEDKNQRAAWRGKLADCFSLID